ncbi:unnamed protein product, partial [Nesidiocoris tenuis]
MYPKRTTKFFSTIIVQKPNFRELGYLISRTDTLPHDTRQSTKRSVLFHTQV